MLHHRFRETGHDVGLREEKGTFDLFTITISPDFLERNLGFEKIRRILGLGFSAGILHAHPRRHSVQKFNRRCFWIRKRNSMKFSPHEDCFIASLPYFSLLSLLVYGKFASIPKGESIGLCKGLQFRQPNTSCFNDRLGRMGPRGPQSRPEQAANALCSAALPHPSEAPRFKE